MTDAAALLGAMTGVDPTDAATAAQAGHAYTNYTQFLDKDALEGARIGVWRDGTYDPTISPEIDTIMNATVAKLRAEGATVIDPTRIPIEPAYAPEFTALLCEFKSDIASYLAAHTGAGYPKTLQDLIDFNNAHPNLEGPWNSAIFDQAQATGGRGTADCTAARQQATSIAQAAINDTLAANNLDAIIAPTNGPAWVSDPVLGDLGGDFSKFVGSSSPSAIAGYGTIAVPAGFVGHLPIGVSFIAGRWDEPKLIGLAYAFEQATHVRVPPTFLKTQ
jgi:amidase